MCMFRKYWVRSSRKSKLNIEWFIWSDYLLNAGRKRESWIRQKDRCGQKGDKSNGMQTIEMRAAARDTGGGFVPLVGQQLHVLFSRSADFVLAKLTDEIKLRMDRPCCKPWMIDRSIKLFFIHSSVGTCFGMKIHGRDCLLLISDRRTKTFVQQHCVTHKW